MARYIIEVKYSHDKDGSEVETIELNTKDIQWSMKEYQRNRQPFEWRGKYKYSEGV